MAGKKYSARGRWHMGVALLLLLALLVAAIPAGAQSPGWEVVATGLNNPRGLNFGPEGALYVAEAGSGGADCITPDPGDPTNQICTGKTGAVTRIWRGKQKQIANFVSIAGPDGFGATGPVDVSFQGRTGFVIVGLGADPAMRDALAGDNMIFSYFGQLAQMAASGRWRNIADVSAYEAVANPDGGAVDSNPYAVKALPGKRIVADAGGNSLLQVNTNGSISTLATFPNHLVEAPPFFGLPPGTIIPVDAVPTSVELGPDGNYYVGELASFTVNEAAVFKVAASGGAPEVYADGFTAIIDFAFAPDGSLYVLEIFKNGLLAGEITGDLTGALIHVALDGTRTEIASDGLVAPGGLAVGRDGSLYVTNYSIFPGMGEVVKIHPGAAANSPHSSLGALRFSLPKMNTGLFKLDQSQYSVEGNIR